MAKVDSDVEVVPGGLKGGGDLGRGGRERERFEIEEGGQVDFIGGELELY